MNRIEKLEQKLKGMETILEDSKTKKKKKFKFPFKIKSMMKTGMKRDDFIVVQYLTQKYGIRFKLCRLVQGNLIVVNNKVHVVNPKAIWRYGKHQWYIYKEIDRKPVSNLDYNRVKRRKDDTEADVPLIKAVLGAVQKKPMIQKKNAMIIIGVIVAIAVVLYFLFGG